MPRVFVTPNGYTVLVGKDRRDNDKLTFELAQPHDIWLHAKDHAGSHVVVQWDAENDLLGPQKEDILHAARLAVYHSKARGASRAHVQLCRACDVEKPKRAPPGTVMCLKSDKIIVATL